MSQNTGNRRKQSSGYSGKSSRSGLNSHILAPILVLVALGIAVWVIALCLQRYMVYTRDGGTMVLPETVELRSDVPMKEVEGAVSGLAVVEEVAELPEDALLALEISIDDLLSGRAAELLAEVGGNAVILDMKPTSGVLNWPSEVRFGSEQPEEILQSPSEEDEDIVPNPEEEDEEAETMLPEDEDPSKEDDIEPEPEEGILPAVSDRAREVAFAVAALKRQGVYLIARVSLFQDEALAARGAPILSEEVFGWLDPLSEEVQSYLCELAEELAAMGFSELLLSDIGYPEDWDGAPDEQTQAVLAQRMLSDLTDASRGMQLGVEIHPDGTGEYVLPVAGMSSGELLECCSRVWCNGTLCWGAASVFPEENLNDGRIALGVAQFSEGAGSPVQVIFLS